MTDAIRHNKKVNLLAFLSIMIVFIPYVLWGKSIEVKRQLCHYRIDIPSSWDTIPQILLEEKIKAHPIDIALYPKNQYGYFSGNYVLINFFSTDKPLINYRLDQIQKEIKSMDSKLNKENHMEPIFLGKLQIDTTGLPQILNAFKIHDNSMLLQSLQILNISKYGYVSIVAYQKEESLLSIYNLEKLFNHSVSIESEYQYNEPAKSTLAYWHLILSLGIGIIVYLFIKYII